MAVNSASTSASSSASCSVASLLEHSNLNIAPPSRTLSTATTLSCSSTASTSSLFQDKWSETPRVVARSEARAAASALALAFATDDFAKYCALLDDDQDEDVVDEKTGHKTGDKVKKGGISAEERWRLHVDLMTYSVAAHCLDGVVTTIGPDFDCVALWLLPRKRSGGWLTTLRSGMWRLYFQLPAEGRRRFFNEIAPLLHETKQKVLGTRNREAYYLVDIGTKPGSQGKGYARKLMEDMLRRADAEHRPVYLESTAQANNGYYKKFGFEVERDICLERGKTPVRLTVMVREPRSPAPAPIV